MVSNKSWFFFHVKVIFTSFKVVSPSNSLFSTANHVYMFLLNSRTCLAPSVQWLHRGRKGFWFSVSLSICFHGSHCWVTQRQILMTNKQTKKKERERIVAAQRLDDRQGQNPLKKMKFNPTAPLTKRNRKVNFGAVFFNPFSFYGILFD